MGSTSVHLRRGEYDKAVADLTDAIRLEPKSPRGYSNRGNIYLLRGQYDKAAADLDEALRLDPNNAVVIHNRAWVWATCPEAKYRDGKRAVESATLACQLTSWQNAQMIDGLAAAYAEAGDFDAAVKYQKRVLEFTGLAQNSSVIAQQQLRLYEDHKPYHEGQPALPPPQAIGDPSIRRGP